MLYYILGFITIIILIILYLWYYPSIGFNVLNTVLRYDDCIRTPYINTDYHQMFPASKILEANWNDIKLQGQALYHEYDKTYNYLNNYNLDLGLEDKKHWTTIPLKLFGKYHTNNCRKCPTLYDILLNNSQIISCIYSFMEPGKIIQPHIGPYDGLLRYQLALDIPIGECYLYLQNTNNNFIKHYWTEGKGVVFDETRIHGAVNNTKFVRLVLLIDIKRQYNSQWLNYFNQLVIYGLSMV